MKPGTCLVLGGTGFVGSAFVAESARRGWRVTWVGSRDAHSVIGASFDLVINADGNSRKYLAQQNPAEDFDLSVRTVARSLHEIRAARYVYLSSSEVYPDPSDPARNAEDAPIAPAQLSPYGFHKYLAETLVRRYAPCWSILRISGLIGPRLRKNAVYDVLTGAPLRVHPDSEFQFIDTRVLAAAVFDLLERSALENDLVNMGGAGVVSVRQMAEWVGRSLPDEAAALPRVRCELCLDRWRQWMSIPQTAEAVRAFIREWEAGGGAS